MFLPYSSCTFGERTLGPGSCYAANQEQSQFNNDVKIHNVQSAIIMYACIMAFGAVGLELWLNRPMGGYTLSFVFLVFK